MPEMLEFLAGHFPGFPVVPAMVQIDWVMDVTRDLLGGPPVLLRLEGLKFEALLRPADIVRLTTDLSPDKTVLNFRLWNNDRGFSSGRCALGQYRETAA